MVVDCGARIRIARRFSLFSRGGDECTQSVGSFNYREFRTSRGPRGSSRVTRRNVMLVPLGSRVFRFVSTVATLAAVVLLSSGASAALLLDDRWTDASRTNTSLPT